MRGLSALVNLAALALVLLWSVPTLGLLITSFRERDQISASGWWRAALPQEQTRVIRTEAFAGGTLTGDLGGPVTAWGITARAPAALAPDTTAQLKSGATLHLRADGTYRLTSPTPLKPQRFFATSRLPPDLSLASYRQMLGAQGLGRALLNSFTVTLPATVIPILIAAYAAYALAWMRFKGRALILALIVGLLVVPLQIALIPLLSLHNSLGIGKSYLGIWAAHTGFGLPLAIYLLRNYMVGLPREMIESARVDGASEMQIFRRLVLPLSLPALASFAIFQFLWVWNDLLVASVFLGNTSGQQVLTVHLRGLLGARGGEWDMLAAAAFLSIAVPLAVFFGLQKYLIRGLLAGSIKGG